MKYAPLVLVLFAGLGSATAAQAAEQTITLSIPAMDCEACPYIIEQTIGRLLGVWSVEATLEDRTAAVTFDDAIVTVAAIIGATLAVGYEATPIEPAT